MSPPLRMPLVAWLRARASIIAVLVMVMVLMFHALSPVYMRRDYAFVALLAACLFAMFALLWRPTRAISLWQEDHGTDVGERAGGRDDGGTSGRVLLAQQ